MGNATLGAGQALVLTVQPLSALSLERWRSAVEGEVSAVNAAVAAPAASVSPHIALNCRVRGRSRGPRGPRADARIRGTPPRATVASMPSCCAERISTRAGSEH